MGQRVPQTSDGGGPDADPRAPHVGSADAALGDFLIVANYKAAAGEHLAVYQWLGSAWALRVQLDAPGAGEVTHCPVVATGEHLVVVSTWFAGGSFSARSLVFAYDPRYRMPRAPPFVLPCP